METVLSFGDRIYKGFLKLCRLIADSVANCVGKLGSCPIFVILTTMLSWINIFSHNSVRVVKNGSWYAPAAAARAPVGYGEIGCGRR